MHEFSTQVAGTPCVCRVTHYKPYEPARGMNGPMEDAEEAIPSEFDFGLYSISGERATRLEAAITEADIDRLQDEYEAAVLADKHGKDF